MLYAIVAIIALIIDQAVKYWTTTHIVLATGTQKLIPGFIYLTNYHNEGAAFSMLSGARWLFVALCLIFVAVVIYVLAVDIIKGKVARWSAVIVLAGAVGNCIDRILNGFVVDMFVFEFVDFAVFNVADIYITCGAIVFCICVLLDKTELSVPKKAPKAQIIGENGEAAPIENPEPAEKKSFVSKNLFKKAPSFDEKLSAPRSHAAPVSRPIEIDPNDPFAEWEKRATDVKKAEQDAAARIEANPFSQPAAPAAPTASAAPIAQEQPVQPSKSAAQAADDMSFNLDDILAEFKD